ncbi:MAG: TerB family tellurite resistance protein [Gammaproteobacteria bacterium]|jgi:uncharacterized tellurite resistance protein B-like protein
MLKTIKEFFEQNISTEAQEDNDHRLKLATAALLIEMMKQDGKTRDEEVVALKNALQSKFALSETETHELIELASEEARQAVDFYQFTSLIHKHFPPERKIKIIEYLWTIAYADNHLDAHEEHLVRRIADLLYISHKDLMQTKHKVQKQLGAE